MTITKKEVNGSLKTILIAVAVWLIVVPLREKIIEISPIKNTIVLGIILLGIIWHVYN